MTRLILTAIVAVLAFPSFSQEVVVPAETVHTHHIPAVPMDLVRRADAYTNYRSASFAQWHPERLEMLVLTRFADTSQVHEVTRPGGAA